MYLSTNNTTGKRDGYYEAKRKQAPNEYKKKERSGWPPNILCAIGVCHRGSTSLRIVPENVKVNKKVFLRELLIPIGKKDIPRLYLDEKRKVILPMNGARTFFHPSVVQWLKTSEIKYVPARHWPTNLSDLSPMEYRILEILKKILVIVEVQRLKANWSKRRRKCGRK